MGIAWLSIFCSMDSKFDVEMIVATRRTGEPSEAQALKVFRECVEAVRTKMLIHRENRQDKEFHFQNWIRDRLQQTNLAFEAAGRNSYPDFRLVAYTVGFEVKGLAYPGRELNYDCNSQVPTGFHNGRTIYYVFGRYPSEVDGNSYPLLDLVVCHGDFLNADHQYVHKNKSVKGFGSYGDIMIRDRKMYVAPTPFGLLSGVAHAESLFSPQRWILAKESSASAPLSEPKRPISSWAIHSISGPI